MPPTQRRKASSAADFKRKPEPIELPSGLFMTVKKTSLAGFIQSGNIPNGLLKTIQGAVDARKGKGQIDEQEAITAMIGDTDQLSELFMAVDRFVVGVALEPRVYFPPEDDADRDDDTVYVDELDDDDKMFLFQRAMGGANDLESFRAESAGGVDSVQQREDVELPAERPAAARTRKPRARS